MTNVIIVAITMSILTIVGTTVLMAIVLNKIIQNLSRKLQTKLEILTRVNLKDFVDTSLD
jgi:hypothetical protein